MNAQIKYDHLSNETQRAIGIFRLHQPKRFYTDRMIKIETEVTRAIPQNEMAEFVRITTEMQEDAE